MFDGVIMSRRLAIIRSPHPLNKGMSL